MSLDGHYSLNQFIVSQDGGTAFSFSARNNTISFMSKIDATSEHVRDQLSGILPSSFVERAPIIAREADKLINDSLNCGWGLTRMYLSVEADKERFTTFYRKYSEPGKEKIAYCKPSDTLRVLLVTPILMEHCKSLSNLKRGRVTSVIVLTDGALNICRPREDDAPSMKRPPLRTIVQNHQQANLHQAAKRVCRLPSVEGSQAAREEATKATPPLQPAVAMLETVAENHSLLSAHDEASLSSLLGVKLQHLKIGRTEILASILRSIQSGKSYDGMIDEMNQTIDSSYPEAYKKLMQVNEGAVIECVSGFLRGLAAREAIGNTVELVIRNTHSNERQQLATRHDDEHEMGWDRVWGCVRSVLATLDEARSNGSFNAAIELAKSSFDNALVVQRQNLTEMVDRQNTEADTLFTRQRVDESNAPRVSVSFSLSDLLEQARLKFDTCLEQNVQKYWDQQQTELEQLLEGGGDDRWAQGEQWALDHLANEPSSGRATSAFTGKSAAERRAMLAAIRAAKPRSDCSFINYLHDQHLASCDLQDALNFVMYGDTSELNVVQPLKRLLVAWKLYVSGDITKERLAAAYDKFRVEMPAAIAQIGDGEYAKSTNLGQGYKSVKNTRGFLIEHFATDDDIARQSPADKAAHNLTILESPCVRVFLQSVGRCLAQEAESQRLGHRAEKSAIVCNSVVGFDASCISYKVEDAGAVDTCCNKAGITKAVFYAISFANVGVKSELSYAEHGEPVPIMTASAHTHRIFYDCSPPTTTERVMYTGNVSHGQNFLSEATKCLPQEEKDRMNRVLASFYSRIPEVNAPEGFTTDIMNYWGGVMPPGMEEELAALRLEGSMRGGATVKEAWRLEIARGELTEKEKRIVGSFYVRVVKFAKARGISSFKEAASLMMREMSLERTVSEETRAKMSEAAKGRNHTGKGKKHTEEAKAKMSEAGKGRKHTAETKAKMSKAAKGRELTAEQRAKIRRP